MKATTLSPTSQAPGQGQRLGSGTIQDLGQCGQIVLIAIAQEEVFVG